MYVKREEERKKLIPYKSKIKDIFFTLLPTQFEVGRGNKRFLLP